MKSCKLSKSYRPSTQSCNINVKKYMKNAIFYLLPHGVLHFDGVLHKATATLRLLCKNAAIFIILIKKKSLSCEHATLILCLYIGSKKCKVVNTSDLTRIVLLALATIDVLKCSVFLKSVHPYRWD